MKALRSVDILFLLHLLVHWKKECLYLFLRLNDDAATNQSESKIADAVIVIDHGNIKLSSIHLIENEQGAKLNNLLVDKLEEKRMPFLMKVMVLLLIIMQPFN